MWNEAQYRYVCETSQSTRIAKKLKIGTTLFASSPENPYFCCSGGTCWRLRHLVGLGLSPSKEELASLASVSLVANITVVCEPYFSPPGGSVSASTTPLLSFIESQGQKPSCLVVIPVWLLKPWFWVAAATLFIPGAEIGWLRRFLIRLYAL